MKTFASFVEIVLKRRQVLKSIRVECTDRQGSLVWFLLNCQVCKDEFEMRLKHMQWMHIKKFGNIKRRFASLVTIVLKITKVLKDI